MTDRAWAKLTIGGRVNAAELSAILHQNADVDLEDCLDTDGSFTLEDEEANGGQFEYLEAALVDAKIAFTRVNDAYPGSFSAGRKEFRPALPPAEQEFEFETNGAYDPVVEAVALWKILDEAKNDRAAVIGIRAHLTGHAPKMPPLPKLELVGTAHTTGGKRK